MEDPDNGKATGDAGAGSRASGTVEGDDKCSDFS